MNADLSLWEPSVKVQVAEAFASIDYSWYKSLVYDGLIERERAFIEAYEADGLIFHPQGNDKIQFVWQQDGDIHSLSFENWDEAGMYLRNMQVPAIQNNLRDMDSAPSVEPNKDENSSGSSVTGVVDESASIQLLGRLVSDCNAFLSGELGNESRLWAKSVRDQIQTMREIYDGLSEKPEWLSPDIINDYARRMWGVALTHSNASQLETGTVLIEREEPDFQLVEPLRTEDEIDEEVQSKPFEFELRRLSVLKADCEYVIGSASGVTKHLSGGNIEHHVAEMRRIYDILPDEGKPEWLNANDIEQYKVRLEKANVEYLAQNGNTIEFNENEVNSDGFRDALTRADVDWITIAAGIDGTRVFVVGEWDYEKVAEILSALQEQAVEVPADVVPDSFAFHLTYCDDNTLGPLVGEDGISFAAFNRLLTDLNNDIKNEKEDSWLSNSFVAYFTIHAVIDNKPFDYYGSYSVGNKSEDLISDINTLASVKQANAQRDTDSSAEPDAHWQTVQERLVPMLRSAETLDDVGLGFVNRVRSGEVAKELAERRTVESVSVAIPFSEHPALCDIAKYGEPLVHGGAVLSFAEANKMLRVLDSEQYALQMGGYDKTDFRIAVKSPGVPELSFYAGRFDIGSEQCDLVSHIRKSLAYYSDSSNDWVLENHREDARQGLQQFLPVLERHVDLTEAENSRVNTFLSEWHENPRNRVARIEHIVDGLAEWQKNLVTAMNVLGYSFVPYSSATNTILTFAHRKKGELSRFESRYVNQEFKDWNQLEAFIGERLRVGDIGTGFRPEYAPERSLRISELLSNAQSLKSLSSSPSPSMGDGEAVLVRESGNFRINDALLGENGGPKSRFRVNVEAIRILKMLELDVRPATVAEHEVLSKYVGWGGLGSSFDSSAQDWTHEYQELRNLLTEDEYVAARESTVNAFFTSPTIINAMYDGIGRLGFNTGIIFEPSMGVGKVFGCLPEGMQGSHLYGVELDSLSGRIAQKLYPDANITVAGFETTNRRDFFDLAIGNVPFGDYQIFDLEYEKQHFSVHNYFFAKALDQVRPGGVVAFVTSRYTMDSQNSTARSYIAERADLLGAIRLPNNAFKANAGTDVVSDIIFLQKRHGPVADMPDWVYTTQNEDGFSVNNYFVEHPEMILGEVGSVSSRYGPEFTVNPFAGRDLGDLLRVAGGHISGSYEVAYRPEINEKTGVVEKEYEFIPADPDVKNFYYAIIDGKA